MTIIYDKWQWEYKFFFKPKLSQFKKLIWLRKGYVAKRYVTYTYNSQTWYEIEFQYFTVGEFLMHHLSNS